LANALAALEEGVETFDSSIGGLGGCPYAPGATGNVATEDLVFMFEEMGLRIGVSIEELARATELVEGLVQRPLATRVPRNLLRKIS
jgi:hydroxymethylglutaryl-CoA lyase